MKHGGMAVEEDIEGILITFEGIQIIIQEYGDNTIVGEGVKRECS
jgi:hypothetical protein